MGKRPKSSTRNCQKKTRRTSGFTTPMSFGLSFTLWQVSLRHGVSSNSLKASDPVIEAGREAFLKLWALQQSVHNRSVLADASCSHRCCDCIIRPDTCDGVNKFSYPHPTADVLPCVDQRSQQ